MTPDVFDRLAASTRLKPIALGMARRVLVDGITATAAAREAGRTRSESSRAAQRIRAALLAEAGLPPGWRVVTVAAPPAVADEIERLAKRSRR